MLLWYFLQGYAIIEIQAANIDRALFQISMAGIELVGVSRISYTRLQAKVSRRNLKRLQQLLQSGEKLRILHKKGVWRAVSQAKRHLALLIGVICMAMIILVLSTCCLRIDISGNERVSEYAIYETALGNGAKVFAPKRKQALVQIEQALWEAFPEFSYVYVTYEGASLRIEVREKYLAPEIAKTQPCSVYAAQDGVITKLTVYSGKAMVQVGDRVRKGDLLIAGGYYIGEQEFSVHADGEVLANVDAISSVLIQQEQLSTLQATGRQAVGHILRLGKREFVLDGEDPFAQSSQQHTVIADMGENSPLYLQVMEVTYRELKPEFSEEQKQAAVLEQQEKAYANMAQQFGAEAEILSFETYEKQTEQGLRVTFTLRAHMSVGEQGEVNVPQPLQTESFE